MDETPSEDGIELELDERAEDEPEDELLLGDPDMMAEEESLAESEVEPVASAKPAGRRTWLSREEAPAAEAEEVPAPAPSGGTLFERMSNIARGAAKAQVDEDGSETEAPRVRSGRDPLDIPRFLNRQNNQ